MYSTSDIKRGLKFEVDGQPFEVIEFLHVKPGKGQAFVRTKVRNLLSGAMLDKTFKTGENLAPADMAQNSGQFLYMEGDDWVFMDNESYEQHSLAEKILGDGVLYLQEGDEVSLLYYKGEVVSVTPPNFVELEIIETDPELKGATVSSSPKPAKLSTGVTVNVPPFLNIGDRVKVDTRTGAYIERVKG